MSVVSDDEVSKRRKNPNDEGKEILPYLYEKLVRND